MVWTDSWSSIAGADEEQMRKVLAEKWRDKYAWFEELSGRTLSSAGRIVAKKQDKVMNESVQGSGLQLESPCGVWLVYSTKPTPSQTTMAAKS
jgi:hypothetical protein